MSLMNLTGMAMGIVAVAIFLGLWQWFDSRLREPDMTDEDRRFFRSQDLRRGLGIAVMLVLAVTIGLMPLGNRWESRPARLYWQLGVVGALVVLILVLLVLALIDWMATRQYARRHRRALHAEHSKLMLEVIRRAGSSDSITRPKDTKSEGPSPPASE
jgi:sterol desaturase/sphingolipid hydroxylase (fatty acid hydroxylase superfamily)